MSKNIIQSPLLNVQEAAEYLGVHAATIRRWAYTKHLNGAKIGKRGDWRFTHADLHRIMHSDISASAGVNATGSFSSLSDFIFERENAHMVQYYEDYHFLTQNIRKFISSGDVAIVVAMGSHKEKIETGLALSGIDVAKAAQFGSYLFLDAEEALSQFMVDGMPDGTLFFKVIGGLITRASRNGNKLRVFGEMVAFLWAQGNQQAAMRLEELWNEMQKMHTFSLFCGYPMHGFGDKDNGISFEIIEKKHSHVIPSESYSLLQNENDKLREIARLQQKAESLASEIIEHKKTEMKLVSSMNNLRASEEFNRRIIENSVDCIKVLDLQGNLLIMNQPGRKVFEIDDFAPYVGKDYRVFWKDQDYINATKAIQKAINGEIGRFQGFCPTAKGTPKWWDVVITPMSEGQGKIDRLLAISRDISSFKELEQRKDDFLSATSHELKTPLTSQKAFIQLLAQQIEKNHDTKYSRYITKISTQTDKLAKLVTDLLDVSKVQGGKLALHITPFDLNECVLEAVQEVQTIVSTHEITIIGNVESSIYGDKEKISQVIVNFLTNAVKYSPYKNIIHVNVEEEGENVRVSVHDFGIGIEKKDHAKIFERFYRVNDADEKTYPGMGIGLYISSEIIKQHGGKIDVSSEKGEGSTFSFCLPRQ